MALLGQGFEDPRSAAIMALAGGLLKGDFGGGLLGANQAYAQSQEGALKRQLAQAQIEESQAQTMQHRALAQKEADALALAQRQQNVLPSLFRQPGMTGGQAVPQEIGGVPMFSKPMQAAPMQSTPGGFDVQGAIRERFTPEQIKAYAGLNDIGRPEVARTVDIAGPRGEKLTQAYDKFNQPIGQPMNAFEAAQFLNLGDRQVAAVPRAGMSLPVGMSPSDRDASARGWAGINIQKQQADQAGWQYDADRGGRVNVRTGAFEPIMQGGQPVGPKNKELTDAQAKALLFSSRMRESDRIINDLAKSDTTTSIPGSQSPYFGSVINAVSPAENQMLDQAKRDFINATLRRESGAVISPQEFDNAEKQYFPQIGDSPAVKAQKARNRALATSGIEAEVPASRRGAIQANTPETVSNIPPGVTPLKWNPATRSFN